jgi:uncharacterized protein GlcG (DUF336 family)
LPSWDELRAALNAATAAQNGFLHNNMWGTIVDRDGVVCAVAFTGRDRTTQWLGSRVISAQKANTANLLSLPPGSSGAFPQGLALSTANPYTAVQPGGSLFGLQESNPVSTDVAYSGSPDRYGLQNDPMLGGRIGGVNVFGGGVPLYNSDRVLIGGLGVSGDTSCADHNVAYRTRNLLQLDWVPAGVSGNATRRDTIVYDIAPPARPDAWREPKRLGPPDVLRAGRCGRGDSSRQPLATVPPARPSGGGLRTDARGSVQHAIHRNSPSAREGGRDARASRPVW